MIGTRVRLLERAFFGRLFEHDWLSSPVAASSGVVWALAALATPGVMMSGNQMFYYAHARTFAPAIQDRLLTISQTFHVGFAMAVAFAVTMAIWTSLAPDRRDALVLGPLPLRPAEQAWARLLALSRFALLAAGAVAVPTAVAFTFLTAGPRQVAEVPARIAGHVAGTMLGAAFVFYALLDVALVLAATRGPSAVRAMTLPLQAATAVAMVAAISFTTPLADRLVQPEALATTWVTWNPAAWFVGLYRWIAGDARPVMAVLAVRAVLGVTVAAGVAVLAYPMAYARCLDRAIAAEGARSGRWAALALRAWTLALSPALRTPLERGLAAFVVATLTRSAPHRFVIGSYLAIAFVTALPALGRVAGGAAGPHVRDAWFAAPLGLLWWSAAGVRVAMMFPTEPGANWVFRLTEPVDKRRVLNTAATVLLGATALPLALAFGAAAAVVAGVGLGVAVTLVVLAAGALLVEVLTLRLRAVPCTCTYRPGQLRLRVLWPVYLLAWIAFSELLPRLAVHAATSRAHLATLTMALAALAAGVHWWRRTAAMRLDSFVYEASEAPATTTLALGVPSA